MTDWKLIALGIGVIGLTAVTPIPDEVAGYPIGGLILAKGVGLI